MIVEILNTGSEIMLGRVLNTHQFWLCRRLADLGLVVSRQVAIPDAAEAIEQAVREALARADLVITTGGLGPTSDDLTRDIVARMLGRELKYDPAVATRVEAFFTSRNRPVPERSRAEAFVPEGALVLPNHHGTAPGLALEIPAGGSRARAAWLILLPGPPRELQPMFSNFAVPLLRRVFPMAHPFVCRTLRTSRVGEAILEEKIGPTLRPLVGRGLDVGYCARPGQADVRLSMAGENAAAIVSEAEGLLREQLGDFVFGHDDDTIESIIIRALAERRQTVALAESCTGGSIADRLTNIPGASAVFAGGFVTYSNQLKQTALGVRAETLARHGAVSEPVAREMAEGARRVAGCDYAIAVTGIAGPDGGTPDKPVGTVFLALASARGTEVSRLFNPWDRVTFKEVTGRQALDQLRLLLRR